MDSDEGSSGWDYFWRGVQVVGGAGEVAAGAVLAGVGVVAEAPTAGASTLGVVGGYALGVHGVDQIYAGIYGVDSVAKQIGTAIAGPWGGVIAEIGPGAGGLIKGGLAGVKSLGALFRGLREAGTLGELLAQARSAGKLTELLKSGSLSSDEVAELLKNGEVTVEELKAAGLEPMGVKVSLSPGSSAEEVAALGKLEGKSAAEIEAQLKAAGYTSVPGRGGGTVWTKAASNGETVSVRIDPPKIKKNPLGFNDEYPHVHKEVVPTEKVVNGNYNLDDAVRLDDNGVPNSDPRKNHILGGH